MQYAQSSVDLVSAYSLLFDSNLRSSPTELKELHPNQLKNAFRKKALATHPDRSSMLGLPEAVLQVKFQQISNAYEVLKIYISREQKGFDRRAASRPGRKPSAAKQKEKSAGPKKSQEHYFRGVFPERVLKIGQYLYYSQVISWQTLIDAIVWQKKQRPMFGQIAKEWGYLTSDDIIKIITQKKFHDRFGDYALRNGYLTSFQQMAVAGKQRICQPLIGQHFIRNGIVSEFQMQAMNRQFLLHNRRMRSMRSRI